MLLDNVKVGDRLEIKLKRENDIGKSFVSQVEKVLPSSQVLIYTPISYGQLVKLPLKEKYSLLFFTEKGMISFDAIAHKHRKIDGFDAMIFKIITDGQRIQRREFFRYNCILPFKFSIPIDDETSKEGEGIIKDLSGGGIRFVSNEELEENKPLNCIINLDNDVIIALGTVLHKQYFPKSNYKYQYRIRFIGILPSEQEKIVQFIFNEQRKVIRRIRD